MTTPFPQTMDFTGYNAPSRIEADIYDLVVEGEIPAEIAGRWYRATPDPQYPPMQGDDTYLSGDGMISMFLIEDGHVDYKSRYVMTERLKNDRKARRSLYGRYRNPYTDDASVRHAPGRSAANTTPIFHAGRLLATKEDGRPMELDPDTLATIGEYDFGGKLRSQTVTAHVRIDTDTGYMYMFGYEAGGLATRDFAYGIVDPSGELISEQWFEAPYVGMVHDFAVTKSHVIFPFFPVTADLDRLKAGGPHWVWNPDEETVIGIMPREGKVEDIRWFRGPPAVSFHFMNAFSEGEVVHVDFGLSEMVPFPFMQRDSGLEPRLGGARNGVVRWTFDLAGQANTWSERPIAPPGDFPRVADKDHMKDYEISYYQGFDPGNGPPLAAGPVGVGFNTLYRLNVKTGERRAYNAGPQTTLQEHVHIASKQAGHEGWLLFVVDQHDSQLSQVHLLEAEHPEKGPIARIHVPMRLRNQVHGSWVAEEMVAG
ncbi:carotenoid oxygenase family protein [Sphingobium sp. HWE2-09]|uniref:carotenoid oxygenase family protein n=1 Tax=Sphingobium sp. HWE2-09 TaxID=3108390 RepID=UPI002DC4F318|nr:carotenoid oxygenase family protein [Sphingobium sp. HWE2-09]